MITTAEKCIIKFGKNFPSFPTSFVIRSLSFTVNGLCSQCSPNLI